MPLTRWERKELVPLGQVSAIAERLHKSQGTVSNVLNGRSRSRVIEAALAEVMGLPVEMVFPPLSPREPRKPKAAPAADSRAA